MIAALIFTFTLIIGVVSVLAYAAFGMKGYVVIVAITAILSALLGVKFAQMLSQKGDNHGKN